MKPGAFIIVTILLAAFSLSFSAYTVTRVNDAVRIQKSRGETLHALAGLCERAARDRCGLERCEAIASQSPADLAAAAETAVPGAKATVENPRDQKLTAGWSLRTCGVTFGEIAFSDAGRFIEYVENQRPPWRVSACDFAAAAPGRGSAKLVLETVVKDGAVNDKFQSLEVPPAKISNDWKSDAPMLQAAP